MIQKLSFFVGALGALVVPAAMAWQKEALLASGEVVYLELAPRDPRSLMQGDYMTLDYAIAREMRDLDAAWPSRGELVVRIDADGVAHLEGLYTGASLDDDERRLDYELGRGSARGWGSAPRIASTSFFFEEGTAGRYEAARYGEIRLSPSGDAMLVGLRGETLEPLGPAPE